MKFQEFNIEFTPDKIKNSDFGILKIQIQNEEILIFAGLISEPDTLTGLKIVSYFSGRKK